MYSLENKLNEYKIKECDYLANNLKCENDSNGNLINNSTEISNIQKKIVYLMDKIFEYKKNEEKFENKYKILEENLKKVKLQYFGKVKENLMLEEKLNQKDDIINETKDKFQDSLKNVESQRLLLSVEKQIRERLEDKYKDELKRFTVDMMNLNDSVKNSYSDNYNSNDDREINNLKIM